jgi:hypothetical protein
MMKNAFMPLNGAYSISEVLGEWFISERMYKNNKNVM